MKLIFFMFIGSNIPIDILCSRFGHTLITENLISNQGGLTLADNFFNSKVVKLDGRNPSDIIKGECTLNAEFVDSFLVSTIRNKLFTNDRMKIGNDLFALNILVS